MIDLPGISSLELVAERLGGLRSFVSQCGDPARIAGNPAGIRRLAEHHRASAGRLGTVAALGRDRVSCVLAGSWQGEASAGFAGYWSSFERRLDQLAAAHQQMADRLEQVADGSARLNREVAALLGETEGWLSSAWAAVAARDVGVAARLAGEGMTLVARWERLLVEVEVFAEGIARRLECRLDFARRPVAMGRRAPQRQPPIDLPPQLVGGALRTRLRAPRASLMPDRRRAGPGGRRRPLPVPPEVQRPRAPPWIGEEPWLRQPGPRARPRRPPAEPSPRAGSGAGSEPRIEPGEPAVRPGGPPVTVPGTGSPPPAHVWAHHDPGIGAVPTSIEAYLLQLAALCVLTGKHVQRKMKRLSEGRNRGGRKEGGGGAGKK
ncbi:WXG100 family type VII secretion target [Candidatus Nephthysia bennettiae]|uniref:WXG100 family type VII secretion target n=1 Tax=Candidatus Nephthysia bennettiae TaxID=3127016 RepID=A0A934K0K1_9BACT|nr:WXG100 family type VII secretion target [Candidatus Dormibacteraeota bacterium]MBJ7613095.1 WXG100 family type VII secretion target [Candidatus Dormibacteraeota bacterium]